MVFRWLFLRAGHQLVELLVRERLDTITGEMSSRRKEEENKDIPVLWWLVWGVGKGRVKNVRKRVFKNLQAIFAAMLCIHTYGILSK